MQDLTEAQQRTLKALGRAHDQRWEGLSGTRTGEGNSVLGTVASALSRMGLVTWRTQPTASSPGSHRIYRITDAGRRILSEMGDG